MKITSTASRSVDQVTYTPMLTIVTQIVYEEYVDMTPEEFKEKLFESIDNSVKSALEVKI